MRSCAACPEHAWHDLTKTYAKFPSPVIAMIAAQT